MLEYKISISYALEFFTHYLKEMSLNQFIIFELELNTCTKIKNKPNAIYFFPLLQRKLIIN